MLYLYQGFLCYTRVHFNVRTLYPFKDEAQSALFKDPVRTAL